MTGFRVAKGGAQSLFGIKPDLTTLGKIVGGGMPAAAFGGRADIMASIAPDGPVYQAGTLSGNPGRDGGRTRDAGTDRRAGLFTSRLSETNTRLTDGLAPAQRTPASVAVEQEGGMFGFVFTEDGPVRSFAQVAAADIERFKTFFHGMLAEGVYLAPSAFEAGFVSAAHGDEEIDATIDAARKVFATLGLRRARCA